MSDVNLSTQITGQQDVVRGIREMREETRAFESQVKAATIAGAAIGTVIAGSVAAAAITIKNVTVSVGQWANGIKDLSETIGLSVERVQQLSTAARIAGEDAGRLQMIFTALSAKIGEARDGSKAAAEVFQKLKLDPKSFKDSEDAFNKVKDALLAIPEGMQRTQAATEIFGRRMAVTFLQIAQEEERAKKVLQDFGLEMSGRQIAALDEFSKVWNTGQIAMEGWRNVIAMAVAPTLSELINQFLNIKREGDTVDSMVDKMTPHVKALGASFLSLVGGVSSAGIAMKAFYELSSTASTGYSDALKTQARIFFEGDPTGRLQARLDARRKALKDIWDKAAKDIEENGKSTEEAIARVLSSPSLAGKAQKGGEAVGSAFTDGVRKSATKDNPLEKMLEGLQKQYVELSAGSDAALKFTLSTGELGKMTDAASMALKDNIIFLTKQNELLKANAKVAEENAEAMGKHWEETVKKPMDAVQDARTKVLEFARAQAEAADPTIAYTREVTRLLEAFKEFPGILSEENVQKRIEDLTESLKKAQDKTSDFAREMASTATSAFGQMIFSSAKFSDKLKALVSDIGQMIVKITILKPLAKELERIFSGGGEKKKDPLSGLFGSVIGSIGEALIPKGFINMHEGSAAPALRMGNASWMQNARKLHAGLASDEFPAILQTGEKVIPRGGSAGDNIVVNQYFQAGVTRAELASILPKWKNETIAAVADKRRRGARI